MTGSGEFHNYRQIRRRELERIKEMDEDATKTAEQLEFQRKRELIKAEEEQRTAKNRAKRQKRKKAKTESTTPLDITKQSATDIAVESKTETKVAQVTEAPQPEEHSKKNIMTPSNIVVASFVTEQTDSSASHVCNDNLRILDED